jgi:hypothetical protein
LLHARFDGIGKVCEMPDWAGAQARRRLMGIDSTLADIAVRALRRVVETLDRDESSAPGRAMAIASSALEMVDTAVAESRIGKPRFQFGEGDYRSIRQNPHVRDAETLESIRSFLVEQAAGDGARVWDIRVYVLLRDALTCRICGLRIRPGKQVIDHIKPICMGGDNDWDNLRVVHGFCNNSRGPHGRRRVVYSDEYVREYMHRCVRSGYHNEYGENVPREARQ